MGRSKTPEEFFAFFWSKIERRGPADCWPWHGRLNIANGHGRIDRPKNEGPILSHRLAWRYTNGPIPPGLCVLHRCDNPPCCNPAHLFIGTLGDNNADRHTKERDATGKRSGRHTHPETTVRGERIFTAKLSIGNVLDIRRRYANGGITQRQLAAEYGVRQLHIWNIIHRNSWKHI